MARLKTYNVSGGSDGGPIEVVLAVEVESRVEANALIDTMMSGSKGSAKDTADEELLEDKPKKAAKAKKGKKEPEPEPEEAEEEDDEEEEEDDEEEEEEEEEEDEAPPPPAKVKLTDELKGATKLRDVLTILIEQQHIRGKKKLLKTVLALKDKIPALGRIENIEGRVPKALELIDPNMPD